MSAGESSYLDLWRHVQQHDSLREASQDIVDVRASHEENRARAEEALAKVSSLQADLDQAKEA